MGLAAIAVSGCAITSAGVKKGDERNFARSVNDSSAGRAIKARMRRAEGFKLSSVDVEVAQGIVVLTGRVPSPEDKLEAERIAWSGPNVVQVGNEIDLEGKQTILRNTKDGVIKASVKTRLIAKGSVKARNLNIEVHDGVVYLLGVARTPEELEKATRVASTTRGVREVVSYVKLHGSETNGAYTGAPTHVAAAPSMPYSGETYSSAPQPYSDPYAQQGVPQRELPGALSSAPAPLDIDALGDGEPYFLDPQTGERIQLPPGVKPIPYEPDTPGSLGAGALPPPGLAPGQPLPSGPTAPSQMTDMGDALGKEFPSDNELGAYRSGRPGEAVSIIESAPYYIDPDTGMEVQIKYTR